jgi:hypothetical protein
MQTEAPTDYLDLQLVTAVSQWLFCIALIALWIVCQSYSHCIRVYGCCLSESQRNLLAQRRQSEAIDRKLHEDYQRNSFSVKRVLLVGPPHSGKRQFLNLLCRAIHAGHLPGLHLREFTGLKLVRGDDRRDRICVIRLCGRCFLYGHWYVVVYGLCEWCE